MQHFRSKAFAQKHNFCPQTRNVYVGRLSLADKLFDDKTKQLGTQHKPVCLPTTATNY